MDIFHECSLVQLNKLLKEAINKLLKETNRLLSKAISNTYLEVTIEKK